MIICTRASPSSGLLFSASPPVQGVGRQVYNKGGDEQRHPYCIGRGRIHATKKSASPFLFFPATGDDPFGRLPPGSRSLRDFGAALPGYRTAYCLPDSRNGILAAQPRTALGTAARRDNHRFSVRSSGRNRSTSLLIFCRGREKRRDFGRRVGSFSAGVAALGCRGLDPPSARRLQG